jgi:hypothetical protein
MVPAFFGAKVMRDKGRLHRQVARKVLIALIFALMMETACCFETLISDDNTTWCHNPKDIAVSTSKLTS